MALVETAPVVVDHGRTSEEDETESTDSSSGIEVSSAEYTDDEQEVGTVVESVEERAVDPSVSCDLIRRVETSEIEHRESEEETESSEEEEKWFGLTPNDEWLCPITKGLMADPVTIAGTSHGHAFERKAAEAWIKAKNGDFHDPLTRSVIHSKEVEVRPNRRLRNEITRFRKQLSDASKIAGGDELLLSADGEHLTDTSLVQAFFDDKLDEALARQARQTVVSGGPMTDAIRAAEPSVVWRGMVTDEDGRWNCRGQVDAVAFKSDQRCIVRGIGVLPGPMTTLVQCSVLRGRNDGTGTLVAQTSYRDLSLGFETKSFDVLELTFEEILTVDADTLYTIEVHQTNSDGQRSCFVTHCSRESVSVDGQFTVHWCEAANSANGTDVDEGMIPCLYLLPLSLLSAQSSNSDAQSRRVDSITDDSSPSMDQSSTEPEVVLDAAVDSVLSAAESSMSLDARTAELVTGLSHLSLSEASDPILRTDKSAADSSSSFLSSSAASSAPVSSSKPISEILSASISSRLPSSIVDSAPKRDLIKKKEERKPDDSSVMDTAVVSSKRVSSFSSSLSPSCTSATSAMDDCSLSSIVYEMEDVSVSSDGEFELVRGLYTVADWRWNYTGRVSAITLRCDTTCVLSAVGVFPGAQATMCKVRVIEGHNTDTAGPLAGYHGADKPCDESSSAVVSHPKSIVVGYSDERYFIEEEQPSMPKKLELKSPAILFKDTLYTLEISQTNSPDQISWYVHWGRPRVKANGITVSFGDAAFSPNGTDVSEGAFPTLFLKPLPC